MSGGFFRGTTADQDTRFSNKQAKLMKSQKFAPELEHLVDITKVKMDVIRPWIAQRVTELLGFEDDVLINFIYGLLDGKVVNGKEIQISLTGFMEKNTGKFMKELWILLLSAEKNMSGVPQQFLDAKEEETRKKKAETDRISTEIQRRKEEEGRKREQEKADKMDDKVDNSVRANNDASEQNVRHHPRSAADEKETNGRNSSRGRSRVSRSPQSVERSHSPPRGTRSRSNSRSFSNSRSYSDGSHRSRSVSGSPLNRRRSMTPRRRDSRTPRRSLSPVRRPVRSPMRRRSRSPPRRRYRTPLRRRSRTPPLRRSRAPLRRWPPSPLGYRSRSPLHYRSRSPIRRRSRSPVHHRYRSPVQRRSPSPFRRRYRRSASSPRHRSPSPVRRKLATPSRRRSPTPRRYSPEDLGSRSPIHRSPHSPVHRGSLNRRRSPMPSPRDRVRTLEKHSPRQAPRVENFERPTKSRKESSLESRKLPSLSPSPYDAPFGSESPPAPTEKNLKEDRSPSPVRLTREPMVHGSRPSPPQKSIVRKRVTGSPQEEEAMVARDDKDRKSSEKKHIHSSASEVLKDSVQKVHYKEGNQSFRDNVEFRKKDQHEKREPRPEKVPHSQVSEQVSPTTYKGTPPGEGVRESYGGEVRSHPISVKGGARHTSETLSKLSRKAEELIDRRGPIDSDSEATPKHRAEVSEKRKHKRAKREESDNDSYDSQVEGRKESKRRRKEEKRLRKEERRRRREERRRKKEQRRAEKIKVSPPSDQENHDGYSSDGEHVARRDPHSSDIDEESEKKKLEIALREKALETLRAKKGGAGR